jgi:L-lactate dehydrogenase complex protein LldG
MNMPSSSRDTILARIRAATHKGTISLTSAVKGYDTLPRTYIRKGVLDTKTRVARMAERLREYEAEVFMCTPGELSATIAARLSASGKRTFVVPEGLPSEWLIDGYDWRIDRQLSAAEIEQAEGAVTGAHQGIADSGTIVLHHSEAEGRRLVSLLPEWHLCILRASQIVETLPEYFDRCRQAPALATFISGPSATADIEMTRIKGVHGPLFLVVILVQDVE